MKSDGSPQGLRGALRVVRRDGELVVDGGSFDIRFRDGLPAAASVDDGRGPVAVGPADGAPQVAYELVDEVRRATLPRLDGAETAVSKEAPDEVCVTVRGRLVFEDGSAAVDVEQSVRVFDCGVLFCDLHLWVRPGESLLITRASLALRLAGMLASLGKYRWGHDRPVPDPGVEIERPVLYLPADRTVDEAGTFHPYLDVAWSVREHAAFTNRAGFVLEEGRPFGTGHPAAFAHAFGRREGDSLAYRWDLYRGKPLAVRAPYAYANRWGLSLAGPPNNERGRREAKNSLIGARVYTWQNDGVGHGRMGEKAWYPRDRDIDVMAAKGANVLLLHTGWMDAGGEGAGWEGNYVVADREELSRVVARAHRAGMRVGLYIRGLEYYALDRDTRWFTDFLTRDFDGVYVDWSSFLYQPHRYLPASVPVYGEKLQHRQNSTRRAHAFTHFLYTRKLRQLVGRDGFLIGHPGCQHKEYSGFALGYFDAMLTGESAGTTFLNSPEQHVYYGAHSACGALVWTNTHPVTRGPKATAYEAAFGTGPQIVLGSRYPLDPEDEGNQFMVPLWQILASADLAPATLYVPLAYGRKILDSPAGLHFALYHLADGTLLLAGANLSERPLAGELRIDLGELGVTGTGQVTELRQDLAGDGTMRPVPAGPSTGTIAVAEMQPLEIRGYRWLTP
ncbi:MAG: hypothetical protein OXJ90_21535 [Spirochaetaceae bacterium]|nr:hypothetical protein [Spirochaetaceae bacterium]